MPVSVGDSAAHLSRRVCGAMTIDVEDYFQVEAFSATIDRKDWDGLPQRVERNTQRLLEILAEAGVHATFFTLEVHPRRAGPKHASCISASARLRRPIGQSATLSGCVLENIVLIANKPQSRG
jgi:predicted ATPase